MAHCSIRLYWANPSNIGAIFLRGIMKHLRILSLILVAATTCPAQMTPGEKVLDFSQMAATYAMNYGPLQWKRDAINFDLLNIGDWLTQAVNTQDDLD